MAGRYPPYSPARFALPIPTSKLLGSVAVKSATVIASEEHSVDFFHLSIRTPPMIALREG